MTSPFGEDSFDLAQQLLTLLPSDDPLQDQPFFRCLAEELVKVQDANDFDGAYAKALDTLPAPIRRDMPPGLKRNIMLALCSDPDYLEAWARGHYDFPMLSGLNLGAAVRFFMWNPLIWPLELPLYVLVALAFGGAILSAVYGIDLTAQTIQVGQVFALGYLVVVTAILCGFILSVFGLLFLSLFGATIQITDTILGWGRNRRLTAAQRHSAEQTKKVTQA